MVEVYQEIFTQDEMCSTSFPSRLIFNDTCLEVDAKLITKKVETGGVAFNSEEGEEKVEGGDETGKSVINIVDAFNLKETQMDKKGVIQWAKPYVGKIKAILVKENPSRVEAFKSGAQEFVKFLVQKIDIMQVFMTEKMDLDNGLCFIYSVDDKGENYKALFFRDGLKLVKY